MTDIRPVLRKGCSATYVTHFCGAIKCRVISVTPYRPTPWSAISGSETLIEITATRNRYYKKGERLTPPSHDVVPRAAYFPKRYGATIGCYSVEVDKA